MWLDRLREMKKESGQKTRQIAAGSGIPEPTLEKLFAGTTKEPKLSTIRQLVYYFGYTLDDLEEKQKIASVSTDAKDASIDLRLKRIIECYGNMNEEGQSRLMEQAEFLSSKYEKSTCAEEAM